MKPISNEEIQQLTDKYRKAMSPNCTIYGCAVCGIRTVLDELEPIPEKFKIPIDKLKCLRLPKEKVMQLQNDNRRDMNYYDLCKIDEQSYYFLYREYI